MHKKLAKGPSQLIEGENSDRLLNAPLAKQPLRPLPQQMICGSCLKPGHHKRNRRMANRLCLACRARGHLIKNYLIRRTGNITPIRSTHPASPVRGNPGPVGKRTPFLSCDIPPIKHREDQGLEQMAKSGKHMIWPKRKPRCQREWEHKAVPNIWNMNPKGVNRNY